MTESQRLGCIIILSKPPLLFMSLIARVQSVESSSREEKRRPRLGLGVSRSLVDSCLNCREHEVTLPIRNREVSWSQHQRCAGERFHGE